MEDDLTLAALRKALEMRRPAPGLVHDSDRGSQYASGDYTDLLKAHGCQISMSHKASPLFLVRLVLLYSSLWITTRAECMQSSPSRRSRHNVILVRNGPGTPRTLHS